MISLNEEMMELNHRMEELMAKKKKSIKKTARAKKTYVKVLSERKMLNQEVKKVGEAIRKMLAENPIEARKHVMNQIESIETTAMFPKDLEKEFNELDKKSFKRKSTVIKVDDYLVGESEVILGGKIGDIEEEFVEREANASTDDSTQAEEEMIPKDLEDTEVGFGEKDTFINEAGGESHDEE